MIRSLKGPRWANGKGLVAGSVDYTEKIERDCPEVRELMIEMPLSYVGFFDEVVNYLLSMASIPCQSSGTPSTINRAEFLRYN